MARDEKLVIKLEERMKFQFQAYADRMGVTMSALGAFVVGQWVDAQNRLNSVSENMVTESINAVQKKVDSMDGMAELEQLLKIRPDFFDRIMDAMVEKEREAKAQA